MECSKLRFHPSVILERTFSTIWFFILIFLKEIMSIISDWRKGYVIGDNLPTLIIMGTIILAVIIYNIFIWRNTTIYIDGKSIVLEKNTVISKKVRTIAIDNVSNVNLEQNLFERIIGTFKLKLDTNTMTTAEKTELNIILKKEIAEKFKNRIICILEDEEEEVIKKIKEDKEEVYDYSYSITEVIGHAFYNISILGCIYFIFIAGGFILEFIGTDDDIVSGGLVSLLIKIVFIVIPFIFSILKDIFKFYDFKVGRKEDKIYISYGLLTKRKYTIPVDKINAIIVNEPTISRIFKRKNIEIVNVGMGDEKAEGSQLLLSEKMDINDFDKLRKLLPEFNFEKNIERQSKKSIYCSGAKILVFSLIFFILSYFTTWFFMIAVLVPIIYYAMKYYTWGISLGEEVLGICNGCFKKRTTYISYKKIQFVNIKQGIISKIFKIAHGRIFILSSIINRIKVIGYHNVATLDKIYDKL